MNLFEDILHHRFDAKTFEIFDPTIDSIHRNLRPKISLVGFSGVGKTTITRLIKAEEIPMQHIPTITGDIATIKIGKLHFHLWDFAGQEQFSYLWNNFVKGSDAVLLITDSTLENVEKSKFFLELIKERAPNAHTAVIGNKQDLEDILKPSQIESILGLKTYSMIAKEPNNRDKMIQIIADVLEMSAEVSPLLKPLLERDKLTEEATNSIESGDFAKAALLFEKISDLCIELGDDSLGKEFYEKSKKIREMLKKVGAPATEEPPAPPPTEAPKQPPPSPPTEAPKQPPPSPPTEAPKQPPPPPPTEAPKQPPPPPPTEAPKQPPPPPPTEAPKQPAIKQPAIPSPKKAPPDIPISPLPLKQPTIPGPKRPPKQSPKQAAPSIPRGIPDFSIPSKKEVPKALAEAEAPDDALIKPKIPQSLKLQLNPEDFMVKQRPKSISVVPKDAKDKLKTSPYAHVTNPAQPTQPSTPVAPIKLMKPNTIAKQPVAPIKLIQSTTVSQAPSAPAQPITSTPEPSVSVAQKSETNIPENVLAAQQKQNLKQTILDLKIKKANIQKMALDFDMQELSGEITAEVLEQKKQRLEILEQKINQQIADLEKML